MVFLGVWNVAGLGDVFCVIIPFFFVLSLEVFYGVVPMDAFDRKYREAVGRVCTGLAAKCSKVTRVVCGIGTVIKNA